MDKKVENSCSACGYRQELSCANCTENRFLQRWKTRRGLQMRAQELRSRLFTTLREHELERRKDTAHPYVDVAAAAKVRAVVEEMRTNVLPAFHAKRLSLHQGRCALAKREAALSARQRDVEARRRHLQLMNESVVHGLHWHLEESKRCLSLRRWEKALALFRVFRVETGSVGLCANILGLPLPANVGLWPSVPRRVVASALLLTSRLVNALAAALCLDPLPHPLFCPHDPRAFGRKAGVAVSPPSCRGGDQPECASVGDRGPVPSVVYLLLPPWGNGGSGDEDLERRARRESREEEDDDDDEDERGSGGRAGSEEDEMAGSKTSAELQDGGMASFGTAVALLQIDILNLCIRAEMPPAESSLHPEAVLPNLSALQRHAASQADALRASGAHLPLPTLPQPPPRDPTTEPLVVPFQEPRSGQSSTGPGGTGGGRGGSFSGGGFTESTRPLDSSSSWARRIPPFPEVPSRSEDEEEGWEEVEQNSPHSFCEEEELSSPGSPAGNNSEYGAEDDEGAEGEGAWLRPANWVQSWGKAGVGDNHNGGESSPRDGARGERGRTRSSDGDEEISAAGLIAGLGGLASSLKSFRGSGLGGLPFS